MPRVASLYLPFLPIDRLRLAERDARPEASLPAGGGMSPGSRVQLLPSAEAKGRIAECSVPRGGGWRPGARWAREEKEAQIEALPVHQRPPVRELGRRTEPAKVAFHGERPVPAAGAMRRQDRQPLVTARRSGQRSIIAALCPAARSLGLEPGMAVAQARALVPGLSVVDAEPEKDAALLLRLALFAARRWTPRAALSGEDGLWLDLGGVAHLFGGEAAMCRRILAFCARAGLDARIAVAGTLGAAHALARHGGESSFCCPEGGEAEALAPLPLSALRIEADAIGAARRLGLERIGDLAAMPRGPLERRFGRSLLLRLDQALGIAGEAIEPIVPEAPPSALVRFLEPIATAEAIGEAMRRLVALLADRLETKGLAARGLVLRCARVDGAEQAVAIGTARASRDRRHLLGLLAARIERIEPGFGIEAMQLVARRCEPLAPAAIGNGLAGGKEEADLAPLVDRLASRLGPRRLFRMRAVESDVPERSVERVGPLAEDRAAAVPGLPAHWQRPVRLLARPEPIDRVVALLPDGAPRRFAWRGEDHVVRQADGPERIYGEWWKSRAEADAVRDYFQVEDEAGARFWIFRRGDGVDPRTGDLGWHMHGVFG